MKSIEKRFILRFTAWINVPGSTSYSSAKSELSITLRPLIR